jgi:hypothetical protein
MGRTNEPDRIKELLIEVFADALFEISRELPASLLRQGEAQPDELSKQQDLTLLAETAPLIASAINAFLKAFDQPEIRQRGICRLRSRQGGLEGWGESGDIEVCDWRKRYDDDLCYEHWKLFSLLPTTLRVPLNIDLRTRFEHTHIVGGTGHGKTQLLQLMIYRDLFKIGSVVVIDSQGDLIRTISHLALFDPSLNLADDLVLIDPNDVAYPPALNLFDLEMGDLARYDAADREKLLNGTIALYEYIFGALLGAELTNKQGVIFRYLARLMMVIPGATIQTLIELMEDGEPFRGYMAELDGSARRFFETQFFTHTFDDKASSSTPPRTCSRATAAGCSAASSSPSLPRPPCSAPPSQRIAGAPPSSTSTRRTSILTTRSKTS